MKKIICYVIIALVFTTTALPNEYHEFTNQEGKSIHARIVQYDAKGERVELELQNRKKAWVQLSDLSEEDQAYIRQYAQEKDKPGPTKELSKKELKALGEQYILAWESGDLEKVKPFYLQPQTLSQSKFNELHKVLQDFDVDDVGHGYIVLEVGLIDGKDVLLKYHDYIGRGQRRWMLFTTDGKIKYDSMLQFHPIETALKDILVFYNRGNKYKKKGGFGDGSGGKLTEKIYSSLKNMGIPLYGLDPNDNPNSIDESLDKINEWLMEEGDKWDSSEPKVFLPKELLEEYKRTGKYTP